MFAHLFADPATALPERKPGISRRIAIALGLAAPLAARSAVAASDSADIVGNLVDRAELQAKLFNAGEMQLWHKHVRLGDGFTLMQPFGGKASHGFAATPERLAELSRNFRNGDASLELEASYASDDLVVLVYIERNTGEVHGKPDQDWSLRVTQVFQHDGSDWKLVHRHADPLVHSIGIDLLAALARGEADAKSAS